MDTSPTPEAGLTRAIAAVKTASALARSLNITPSAVLQWDKIPAERIGEVSRITGIPPQDLRPDIFGSMPERAA
jgi:DNA-binding transcriptional regulator YdaS (Cro superfamily)